MRFFFRSKKFKMIVVILALVLASAVIVQFAVGWMAPGSNLASLILTPIQRGFTSISNQVQDAYTSFVKGEALLAENEALKEQIGELQAQLTDAQTAAQENDFYKDFLEIKQEHPDYTFQAAKRIAQDSADLYGTFTIDQGTLNGVSLHDPVISAQGLVGYITEVSLSSAKVTTILSPSLSAGAYDSRTGDAGILSGDTDYASQGVTRLYNLPRNSSIAIGDYAVTSGGGVFPSGLVIGTVTNVKRESQDTTVTATITPTVDFASLREVMVITAFTGQGSLADTEE